MAQPLFPSTISAQLPSVESLTIKTMVRKIHQNNAHTGSSCLDKACLDRGGGGGDHIKSYHRSRHIWVPSLATHLHQCLSRCISVSGHPTPPCC